jgi:alkaline phosphatase isozyme conversion protein
MRIGPGLAAGDENWLPSENCMTLARHVRIVSLLSLLTMLSAALGAPAGAQPTPPIVPGDLTLETLTRHIRALAVEIGARPAATHAEVLAAEYIAAQFEQWGYAVAIQEFEVPAAIPRVSRNVVAHRPSSLPSGDGKTILAGAHMDSVSAGTGADDNAAGVAVLLAAAEALAAMDTVRPITFVAFGAEEVGQHGSQHFVDALSEEALADLLVMVNIDTVGMGDYLHAYAGARSGRTYMDFEPGPTWARDFALETAGALGHAILTTPEESWNGFIGPWSDHAPFAARGVPIVYFERWNWHTGNDPNWGQETVERDYLHTPDDVFENLDVAKVVPVAETVTAFIAALATDTEAPPP